MADIVSDPDILGGKPRIKGARISVVDVVELLEAGYTTPEVARQLDISNAGVQAARRYWREHPEEISALRDQREERYQQLLKQSRAPSG